MHDGDYFSKVAHGLELCPGHRHCCRVNISVVACTTAVPRSSHSYWLNSYINFLIHIPIIICHKMDPLDQSHHRWITLSSAWSARLTVLLFTCSVHSTALCSCTILISDLSWRHKCNKNNYNISRMAVFLHLYTAR